MHTVTTTYIRAIYLEETGDGAFALPDGTMHELSVPPMHRYSHRAVAEYFAWCVRTLGLVADDIRINIVVDSGQWMIRLLDDPIANGV